MAVPGRPAIDGDVGAQLAGRMCEVGVAVGLGLDPMEALDWDATKTDPGYDFMLNILSCDVKSSSHPQASRLIWPVTKKEMFDDHAAEALIWAWGDVPSRRVEARGWINKETFKLQRKTASHGTPPGLNNGTWFMDEADLWDIGHLKTRDTFIPE